MFSTRAPAPARLQVGAIRVSETDRREAEEQLNAMLARKESGKVLVSLQSARSWPAWWGQSQGQGQGSVRVGAFLDEEIYLAQLALRARVLNARFHSKVLGVVQRHGEPRQGALLDAAPAKPDAGADMVEVLCAFDEGPAPVQVHFAEPKSVERMREKALDYLPPHPAAVWPLCANILDPVRLSIVCRGASQVAQAAGWFVGREGATGLRACRVKNGFAAEGEPDGYRDLKVCVLFADGGGLSIIGEIQFHDAVLFDLKQGQVRPRRRRPACATRAPAPGLRDACAAAWPCLHTIDML